MFWEFVIGTFFTILIGIVIYLFTASNKTESLEVKQDKPVWWSFDTSLTKGYLSGFIEQEKKVGGNIVLLIRPTYTAINEKIKDAKPFSIVVTESMLTRSNIGKYSSVLIQPYLSTEFQGDIKNKQYYSEMIDNRTALSMKELEVKKLTNQMVEFTSSAHSSMSEPFSQALQNKLNVKKKIDAFNNNSNNNHGRIPPTNQQRR